MFFLFHFFSPVFVWSYARTERKAFRFFFVCVFHVVTEILLCSLPCVLFGLIWAYMGTDSTSNGLSLDLKSTKCVRSTCTCV